MGLIDRFRRDNRSRVVILGLDGVPHSLLMEHAARFEHIANIADIGGSASIESVLPAESSACWPSLTTGANPGQTGVYGLVDRDVNTYETYINAGTDVQIPHIWDRVAKAGMNASVLNVPVTHPPQRNLQRMVAGFLAPDVERAVYPRSFGRTLRSLDYRIDVDASLGSEGDLDAFLDDAYATLAARYEAFAHVIGLDDWDLFVGVFMTPDRVNHFLFGDYVRDGPRRADFLAFYEQLDTYIGALRSRLPDDVTIILVSDHGFVELDHEAQLNAYLSDRGWLSYATEAVTDLTDIDDSSRAYSLAPGRVYLNLEGRERLGSVPDAEYEIIRNQLREDLRDWTAPDGRPVVDRIVPREQLYRGKHVDLAPDLVLVPHDGFDLKASFTNGAPFLTSVRSGMHQETDAAILTDDPRLDLDEATVYDLAPTVLSLLDIEYDPASVDGTTLLR